MCVKSAMLMVMLLAFVAIPGAAAQQSSQQPSSQPEDSSRQHVPISVEDLLRAKLAGAPSSESPKNDLNERLQALAVVTRVAEDYLLGPGDSISVSVYGVPELNPADYVLDATGTITLPFIDEVNLLGLSAREARVKIATLYESTVLKNAQVLLSVKSFHSQTINVFGAVGRPGAYQLNSSTRIIDVLSLVGGLTEKAVPTAVVRRPLSPTAKVMPPAAPGQEDKTSQGALSSPAQEISYTTIEVDLSRLLNNGDLNLNIPIYGGDMITVAERPQQYIFVLGDVKSSGAFEIKKNEQLTVQRALVLSGGFLGTAKPSKSVIIRQGKDGGQSEQIQINAADILRGKRPDVALQNSDVILVPGSASKTIGRGIVTSLTGIVGTALLYGVIYK